MHAAGLGGKRRKRIWIAAEPHPDALRLAEVTKQQATLLTGVSQPVTLSARKHFARKVQHRDPPTAILAVDPGGADKPWTLAAKVTCAPCDGHALFDVFPL